MSEAHEKVHVRGVYLGIEKLSGDDALLSRALASATIRRSNHLPRQDQAARPHRSRVRPSNG